MKKKIEHTVAAETANAYFSILSAFCDRMEVAGSLRRKQAYVGDIEIVAIPQTTPVGLFGQDVKILVFDRLRKAAADGEICILSGGQKAMSFARRSRGIQVDLYLATPENWGYIMAIRTGPAHFSKRAVTPTSKGGYLMPGYRCSDGYVWERHVPGKTSLEPQRKLDDGGWYAMRRMPEETDFFNLLTCGWIEPEKRG